MTTLTGVRYDVHAGVGRVALARPEVSNSFDLSTARSLGEVVELAAADEEVRVVLITGEGRRFCAGGDVASMAAASDRSHYLRDLAGTLDGAFQRLSEIEKPVVAAVQGAAAGAGLALILAADVVIGASTSKYLTAYAGIGLTPDCGLSWQLPRAIGQQRALELALTGRVLTAEEARDWGLVTTVVDDVELSDQAASLAARLAAAPPFAVGQARRLIRSAWMVSRAESGADEARTISRAVSTQEARDLVERFPSR
jgi:2-(1,2-epoxy-1,2-dihydrophenyl)acetyl-CoA isomerase